MKVEHSDGIKAMTDDQLDAALEALRELVAKRAAEAANVIEGTAQPVALPALTEVEQPRRKRSNRLLEHVDTAIGPTRKLR